MTIGIGSYAENKFPPTIGHDQERRSRTQNRDLTRFDLTIGDEMIRNLPKRHLVFHVVHEAVLRGAPPRDILPPDRAWVIVNGEHDSDSFLEGARNDREPGSSSASIKRFFYGRR